ncbi:uncharacterized protein LOC117123443 [Anneissia japonica]|uniref:uncharacterized protein LOC117123443 n=1 Tax=Anneissia japonica TaxID=1529436 RepID=UPI0014255B5A|nr:uncharacterized protein LOC117123443 [Anneissia japonica]XP_033125247.1 uncharacterized protein LOC117123443 [Anneissia japonica]XP_033125248.1 uncharacterized protein LOC117123443 [Anneissia japonica]
MFTKTMFQTLIFGIAMYITCISPCTNFSYNSTNYEVRSITAPLTWLDVNSICKSFGGQLVSLNTPDEYAALLYFLQTNCHVGIYAIGLSRQPGLDRYVSANWIWESGEAYEGQINWEGRDPGCSNSKHCVVRMLSKNGNFRDFSATRDLSKTTTRGYICEKHVNQNSTYFKTTLPLTGCRHHDAVGAMSAQCFRCALKCFKDDECLAFKYDDVGGCQVKSDLMENTELYYTRLWV